MRNRFPEDAGLGGGVIPDIHMETVRGGTTVRRGHGGELKYTDRLLLESGEVKRKATVAQLCEFWVLLLVL